ncbi:hypothetical protein VD0002_g4654 [Verticillium dahliae]|uniref:Chromo domain-containing protein n=2 Tax=Verticillium dahliae TaxID=27337 RepID=G2XET0_VERDV|nr:chromo domain-containing protein [Verticillium dahliae VdLs.17]KAF3345224.1 Transcriptional repressor XBP1 [Verticillium dahliae VDG2]KAH6709731.1 chromo domain-containing protein [Verticillium dahliae]EGY18331.1 chromo domain-containing protein [Verticillium dahliae VdLs.17]PNH27401.1 hypothetical protein BJF96_g9294 [Verticillium dahliae]PNH52758.1 hypothetical protein VD0003_g4595 [Verticillium dahliae]
MEETDSGSEPAAPSTWKGTLVFGTPEPEFSSEEGVADILESVENPEAYEFETHANKDVSNEALTDLLPESTEYEENELLDATSQEPLAPLAQEFQEDELQPDVPDQHSPETQESQADSPRTTAPERIRPVQFEIVLPQLSPEERARYREVHSDRVDFIYEEVAEQPYDPYYRIEYTDGRQHLVSESDLAAQHGGKTALRRWHAGITPEDIFEMSRGTAHKRSWEDGTEDSASYGSLDDMMDVDDDDEDHMRTLYKRRRTSARASTSRTAPFSSDEDEPTAPAPPARQLRDRQPRQLKLTKLAFANGNSFGDDDDELALANLLNKSDGEDDDFQLITSDVVPRTGRGRKSLKKLKSSRSNYAARSSRDSSIEFEDDRRRSGRSTRNTKIMTDLTAMDDDFSSVEEGKTTTAPKVVSINEVFKPLPPDSDFSEYHISVCDVCNQGSISNRGQMIGCQGCSLSFHKGCIKSRAQRDHMATKVGDDSFVLQCKWCIGIYRKKDANAPHHAMCQSCKEDGKACKPFSKKKTAREEEKLRQDNGGVDPITKVEPYLVNNSEVVLFRCTTCKRGWHFEHLPSSRTESDVAGTREQRLADYSIDWKCEDCSLRNDKVHVLVAWRPTGKKEGAIEDGEATPDFSSLPEDGKEYLVKWADHSYFHCTWMPGAWVHGITAGAMRTTFAKRDAERSLLRMNKQDAIPEEYLLADVILYAKADNQASSKDAEMARIHKVSKIFVKFQGLGYDDAVWDSPPPPESGRPYEAFKEAYEEYLCGKYFAPGVGPKMQERVRAWKRKEFVELKEQPRGIKRGKLMKYQEEGVNWMLSSYHTGRNVILADEMGLGKTVQVVSLITTLIQDSPQCWPFMVVVPNSTCPNWRREIKFWAPDLRVVSYHGGRHSQDLAYKYELFPDGAKDMKAHIVVMSYDSAQDDRTKSLFRSVSWAGLVVDEGQRLKNDQNLLYLALKSMSFPFRLLLTGTPLQNNKRELFNLLQFVDTAHNAAKLDEEYAELNATNLPKLHEKIRPYFLRRTKAQVLKFLPPMAQIILPVSMTILQEKLCKSIMAKSPELIKAIFADDKIKTKDRGSLNNILMQLRKCLAHPFIYSQAIEERSDDPIVTQRNLISASAKLLLLEIMLPKLKERGHRVLLFSQFLNQLDIVEDYLTGRGYDFRRLDGSISSLEKQRRIDAFNAPDSPVFAFLLSTRAGGVGINLATADTVIILDPDFNPHQDLQALSRAHRIGQKNKVLCFQLMTKNSVEEKIMQIGRKKMALDHVLIESMDNENDAGDDLESILKFGASALFSDEQDQKDIIRYDDASVDKLLDRTHIEQAKPDESGSGESQFSFAKVWANDKGTFEDDMAEHEDPTLNPSIWEDILAEREAVAQKLAEAEKVVLGRGGRRRTAINYRTNEANDVAGRTELDGSDVDGDFSADTDEDEESAGENEASADVGITDLAGVVPRRAAVVKDTAPAPPVVAVGSKKRGRPRKTDTPQGERARGLKAKNPDSKQPAVQNTTLSNRPQVVTHQNNPRVHNGIGPLWDSTALFVPGQMMLPSNAPSRAGPGYQNTRQDYQQSQHQSPFFNLPPNQSQQLPQQNLHPQTQGRLNGTGQASPDPWQGQPRQAIVETTLPSPRVSEATKPALPDMAYKAKIPGLTLESALKISKQMVTRIPPHRGHPKAQPAKTTLADMKCTGCLGDHLTSACNGRLTETQIRMALDELARMPDNSVVALEKLELKQRLLSIPV